MYNIRDMNSTDSYRGVDGVEVLSFLNWVNGGDDGSDWDSILAKSKI